MSKFTITNSQVDQLSLSGDNLKISRNGPKIVLVHGWNWSGLYVDGLLRAEDETINASKLVEILRLEHLIEIRSVNPDWFEYREDLPLDLEDVEFES